MFVAGCSSSSVPGSVSVPGVVCASAVAGKAKTMDSIPPTKSAKILFWKVLIFRIFVMDFCFGIKIRSEVCGGFLANPREKFPLFSFLAD